MHFYLFPTSIYTFLYVFTNFLLNHFFILSLLVKAAPEDSYGFVSSEEYINYDERTEHLLINQ